MEIGVMLLVNSCATLLRQRSRSWQNHVCIIITRMSILIFVRVLEHSSQRAYFWSCDGNTAMPLADKLEIGRFMGFSVPY